MDEMMNKYASITSLSSTANYIMVRNEAFTHTYRTYIRTNEQGTLELKFWFSNAVDSTWEHGEVAKGGQPGGDWMIEAAFAADGGTLKDGSTLSGTEVPVTFGGRLSKAVRPGEVFWSDPVRIHLQPGHDLVFTWTITSTAPGKSVPYNVEQMLATAYDAPGNVAGTAEGSMFTLSENMLVMPALISSRISNNDHKRIIFLGDSITQGVRTARDGYEYWVARIAEQMGGASRVWNIGSGWARAYDAAADGPWLNKAKQGDQIFVALGVNDIDIGERSTEELLGDLTSIVSLLKENNNDAEIILFTVPPFNFTGNREHIWYKVNESIRTAPPAGVSRVFDIAAVLSLPAPLEHRLRPEFMSSKDDPHPNGLAGEAVAASFMEWYSQHYL